MDDDAVYKFTAKEKPESINLICLSNVNRTKYDHD